MSDAPKLDDCGCCEGVQAQTPVRISNAPGLTALAYRAGTHSRFKQTMMAALSRPGPLRALKTRRDDDPSIGLLDSWATVLDVLTFYQERIANEGYLRTATDRRSLLELAREIGYELRPGVAAGTWLAFTMETGPAAPGRINIAAGAKAQSVPGQGEQAQIFETVEEIIARPVWNKLRPRPVQPQKFAIDAQALQYAGVKTEVRFLYLSGTSSGLAPGDMLLITTGPANAPTATVTKKVLAIATDNELKRTTVEIESGSAAPGDSPPALTPTEFDLPAFPAGAPLIPFLAENVRTEVLQKRWREEDLQTFLRVNGWNADDLTQFIARERARHSVAGQGVFAFRERTGFFGNGAPPYASLRNNSNAPLYKDDWDEDGWSIWDDYPTAINIIGPPAPSAPAGPMGGVTKRVVSKDNVALDRSLPGILKNSWAIFTDGNLKLSYRINAAVESSVVGFGMSGKATILNVSEVPKSAALEPPAFTVRRTTAHVKSQELELDGVPVPEIIAKGTTALTLDEFVLGLKPGQLAILSGEQASAPGVMREELLFLENIIHHDGLTTLLFREHSAGAGLQYSYLRKTVTVNANVARATHGETRREVLGNGDAARTFQTFALKQFPLTYVSAPTPAGIASTLELRVNDVLWDETPALYLLSPLDRMFATRRSDDGKTTAQFGDGIVGARLPSGIENVTANYRVGLGLGGMVKAGQISLLLTRPLGVKEVINPLPATGAADPETRDAARENAPFTVLTLDRIVSLQDFEDYARAYPGIGKAHATWLWDGERKIIHLTIAGADGSPVSTTSTLYQNLGLSIQGARDPGWHVHIDSFAPVAFNVKAKLLVTRGYLVSKVIAAAAETVRTAFCFDRRAIGQAVTKSELLAIIQDVEGVTAVDLDALYFSSEKPSLAARLPARTAEWNNAHSAIRQGELLLVNPREIQLSEMPV